MKKYFCDGLTGTLKEVEETGKSKALQMILEIRTRMAM